MAWEMQKTCEKCEASPTDQAEASFCSYECTFARLQRDTEHGLPELRRRTRRPAQTETERGGLRRVFWNGTSAESHGPGDRPEGKWSREDAQLDNVLGRSVF